MSKTRTLLCALAAAAVLLAPELAAGQKDVTSVRLLAAATTAVPGAAVQGAGTDKTYQATGTTTAGAGSASIGVQCSNDGTNWDTLGTITLTLATTTSSNSFQSSDRCLMVRGNVTAISGTGASVNLTMAY